MDVSLSELRAAANAVLSHLEQCGTTSVTIPDDYYWDVAKEHRYDRYKVPRVHTGGHLPADLQALQRMARGERPMTGYGLVWLAAILRRIGEISN